MLKWIHASRPATLTAAFVPVAVGTACAYAIGKMAWLPACFALLGAFFIQIGTNFANDVFDADKGADTEDRLGPTRAVATGLISPRAMRRAMFLSFALATCCGSYLVYVAGWPIVVIGIASILSGIAYTGGPYPLGYNGLGDVFVLLFFGFVAVCGTTYVQALQVPRLAVWASIPIGCLATAILVVNNVRDRETDVHAEKRTLAVRFGRNAGIAEYIVLLVAAYAVPMYLATQRHYLVLTPWLTLPWGLILCRQMIKRDGRSLNQTLTSTAKLLLVFGVLFAIGLSHPWFS